MKNFVKHFGIAALTAVIVLSLAACESLGGLSYGQAAGAGTTGADNGVPKTLVITEIEGFSGDVLVTLASTSTPARSMVAVAGAAISNNNVTFPLVLPGREDTRWTGTGEYFVVLVFNQDGSDVIYFYAHGGMSALRYNFTEATTTIAFNQFRKI